MREKSLLVLTRQFQGVNDELVGGNVRVVRISDAQKCVQDSCILVPSLRKLSEEKKS